MLEVLTLTANPLTGGVCWTICAMLFVATSINSMDRQVIGLLKPTLEESIGLTELDFGYMNPGYFDSRFRLGLSHLGLPLTIVCNMSAVGSIGGGWLAQFFGRFGFRDPSSRMAAMLLNACLALPMLLAGRTSSEWVAIALLSVAAGAHQGWSANLFTTASDMFPSNAVGSIVGIGGMAGSVGGVLLSVSAGKISQVRHKYTWLFFIAGFVYLLAIVVLRTLAPQLGRVDFLLSQRMRSLS